MQTHDRHPPRVVHVWLLYDMGVLDDYEGLYSWLDNRDAIECGDSAAWFAVSCDEDDDVFEILSKDLRENVNLSNRARIYAICRNRMGEKKFRGRFIIGRRKRAPWEGYGEQESQEEETEA